MRGRANKLGLLLLVIAALLLRAVPANHTEPPLPSSGTRLAAPPVFFGQTAATTRHACLRGGGGAEVDAASPGAGGCEDNTQDPCKQDVRGSSAAEAGPDRSEGGDMTVSSEEPSAIEDVSDKSIGDGDLVFRDRETQKEWQRFVEQGVSPAPVKLQPGRSHQPPCTPPLKDSPQSPR
jgi:hypothetical protein